MSFGPTSLVCRREIVGKIRAKIDDSDVLGIPVPVADEAVVLCSVPARREVSGRFSNIAMVQPTEDRYGHDLAVFWGIHRPRYRTIFIQADVCSSRVVVAIDVLPKNPMKMSLIENNAVVQTLSAETPN